MQLFLSIFGILLFISLIISHEWGHYWAARRNGVEVEEFGLGIPPRLLAKKLKSGMILSLNWLPLGGFVKLKGEHDADSRHGSFGAASLAAKTKIMLAGVGVNLLSGVLLLTLLAWLGLPKLIDQQTVGQEQFTVPSDTKVIHQEVLANSIVAGSPADHLGLGPTDSLLSLAAGPEKRVITTAESLHQATQAFAGQSVVLTYRHNSQTLTKTIKLLSASEVAASHGNKGYLGLSPRELQIRRSTWSAPVVALGLTKQLITLTLQGIGKALAGLGSIVAGLVTHNHTARQNGQTQASSQVGGPVAIAIFLWTSGSVGLNYVLMLIAIISLLLAFFNVLPFPALDGGRLAMTLVSRGLFRRPLSKLAEERIVATSMAILLMLFVLITVVDVKRFF